MRHNYLDKSLLGNIFWTIGKLERVLSVCQHQVKKSVDEESGTDYIPVGTHTFLCQGLRLFQCLHCKHISTLFVFDYLNLHMLYKHIF